MGYIEDDSYVRVDFFIPRINGAEYYTTESVKWTGDWEKDLITEAFHKSLKDHFGNNPRLIEMYAVCLEPYHRHCFPQMVIVKDYTK